jgi:hypothetical protein
LIIFLQSAAFTRTRVQGMRNIKLTLTVDAALRELLEEGAAREQRSISNYTRRLIDRAAREDVRAQPGEQEPPWAAA